MRRIPASVALVLLVMLSACGDDDGGAGGTATDAGSQTTEGEPTESPTTAPAPDTDAAAEPYVEALADELSGFGVSEDSARCIASGLVDAIGAERLEQEGLTPQEFVELGDFEEAGLEVGDEEVDRLGQHLAGCDLTGFISAAMLAQEEDDWSDESIQCISSAIATEDVGPAMAEFLLLDEQVGLFSALAASFARCPDALTEAVIQGIERSQGSELSEEGRACIAEQVEDNAEGVADLLVDTTGGEELRDEILEACSEFLDAESDG
jgi:hypothetical protein